MVAVRLRVDQQRLNKTPALKCMDDIVDSGMASRLLNDFLKEVFIYSSSRAYNDLSDTRIGESVKYEEGGNVVTYSCYAAKRDGILRVSHPDWDEYYGILS